MKQILQNLSTGQTELVEAPVPQARDGHLLIDTTVSLISTGTERMLVDFGKSSLISKAQSQPEKVRQVLNKITTDGLVSTVEAVRTKLAQPIPLGYCNVGVVNESNVPEFKPGDRVVSNGPHADVVCAPKNLCAHIPDLVSDEPAAFTIVASIGLQGIRLAEPTLGECFVVTGVGLIGLLTVQMLRAQGCRVMAIDFDQDKLELARGYGAEICHLGSGEDPIAAGLAFSRGAGVDGVIITASTKSSDPVTEAARMSRKRGRIVLIGVTGLELNRADFYEKELSFQVSCSYGPGRYDPAYEDNGQDYPLEYVRWTEQRNFEAVLDMLASGALDVSKLISHRVPFNEAPRAYQLLSSDKSALGIALSYDHQKEVRHSQTVVLSDKLHTSAPMAKNAIVGFVGAGNYATRMLIPAFKKTGAILQTIASAGGTNAVVLGRQNDFSKASSDTDALITDPDINTIAIVTRHNSHARLTAASLRAEKHVFVEKPLALNFDELEDVKSAYNEGNVHLMVGFNRRFAPQIQTMKKLLDQVTEPKTFVMVMNAGSIPVDHWTQDPLVGGRRIVGEACHYIDLMRYLTGAPISMVQAIQMGNTDGVSSTEDKASITLRFEDGSFGTIHYLSNGAAAFPKERIEVFTQGRTLQLDNFLMLRGFNWPGFKKQNLWRQDKGQFACVTAFIDAIETGGPSPIAADELFEVAKITLEAVDILRSAK